MRAELGPDPAMGSSTVTMSPHPTHRLNSPADASRHRLVSILTELIPVAGRRGPPRLCGSCPRVDQQVGAVLKLGFFQKWFMFPDLSAR